MGIGERGGIPATLSASSCFASVVQVDFLRVEGAVRGDITFEFLFFYRFPFSLLVSSLWTPDIWCVRAVAGWTKPVNYRFANFQVGHNTAAVWYDRYDTISVMRKGELLRRG